MNAVEIACPACRGPLVSTGEGLRCPLDRLAFPRHPSGLLDLRLPELREEGDRFAAAYREARLVEGLAILAAEDAQKLPEGNPPGYPRLYWQVRRESWAALRGLLLPPAVSLTIADLGAGVPWLSHRLAALGHRVVAVDISPDTDFGLGAARHYASPRSSTPPRSASASVNWRRDVSCRSSGAWSGRHLPLARSTPSSATPASTTPLTSGRQSARSHPRCGPALRCSSWTRRRARSPGPASAAAGCLAGKKSPRPCGQPDYP